MRHAVVCLSAFAVLAFPGSLCAQPEIEPDGGAATEPSDAEDSPAPRTYAFPTTGWTPPVSHEEEQPITGLIAGGAVIFGVGYVFSVVVGSIFLASTSYGCSTVANAWSMLIPLVGGYVWAGIDSTCAYGSSVGDAFGIPSASVQVIGLAMLLAGVFATRTVRVAGPAPESAAIPRVGPGPGDAGLSLVWDL